MSDEQKDQVRIWFAKNRMIFGILMGMLATSSAYLGLYINGSNDEGRDNEQISRLQEQDRELESQQKKNCNEIADLKRAFIKTSIDLTPIFDITPDMTPEQVKVREESNAGKLAARDRVATNFPVEDCQSEGAGAPSPTGTTTTTPGG